MVKRVHVVSVIAALLISSVAAADKLEVADLPSPPLEVIKNPAQVELPALPAFDLPVTDAGFHSPRQLRVRGKAALGTEVKVRGYITWVYDCAAQLASINTEATRAQILLSIDSDPALCEPPKFYLGDRKDTSQDASIWVVEVPRAPTKSERQRLPKEERKALSAAPKIATGDYVTVTGTWAQHSPHNEHNLDGLLIFKSLAATTPGLHAGATAPAVFARDPEIAVATKAPPAKDVDPEIRNASVDHLNACNKAIVAKHYDVALKECELATKAWAGNHLAWFALGSAYIARTEWSPARTAAEQAVVLRPDQPMYQLYYGIALYEAEVQRAREDQARRENKKPDEITLDPTALKLDQARDALVRATRLAPALWRGHYYLGRVYRDLDDPRRAAEQLLQTIAMHPTYRYSYIALIQLYRRWDYLDQALAVASLGTGRVATAESGELWFELGMAYGARRADVKAIEAFGTAIAIRPDDMDAKFQRGQIFARRGELAAAKRDLEEVGRSTDPKLVAAKQVANQLLAEMAARKH
ncbi:MAG: tetratricopeptide repeat protein [Kofleriaceae bacterium]